MKKSFKILGFMFAAVLLFAGLLYIGSERATAADDVTVVTVTDYGANGSDTKSDRTAIQNCLNMAKDGKAVKVVIPAGKYYIDDVLIAYDNTTISLAADAEIIRMDDTKLMLANYRDQVTGGYGQGSNIIVEGGKWNGNVKNTTHLSPLMLFYHAQNITVRNTDVGSYCARHAIIFGGVKKGTVDNVKIHDFVAYTGTDPDGEYYTSDDEFESLCTMEALHLDCIATDGKSEAGALPLDGTPCAEITVSNCTFTNVPVGLGNHYEGYPATGLTVSKNTFSNIKYVCIDSYSYRNVDISGNTAQNVSSFAKFIDSTGTVSGNNITCKATTDKLYGIYVYTNSNIEVNSNTITDSNLDAIALYNAKSSSISNNKIYSPKDNGIAVYGAKSVVTKINDNTVQNGKNGIVLSYSSADVIHGNTITQPSEHGISLVNNATAEISLNEITSPTKNGVSVNKSTATVTANNIKDPVAVGVGLYSASNSEVSKNTITNAGTHGIEVSSSTSCEINGNIIGLPKAQGVRIYASKTITADSNTVVTAAKNGIFIDSSSVTVRSNKISDAKEHGIMVQNNSTGIISSNTVTSPVKNGVSVNNAAVTVSSNKISDAGNVGVMIYNSKQSASKTVSDNQISNAGSHGIEVSDSASCKVNGNTVSFPGGHGIRVYASKTVTVSSNTVDTAARNGVYIDASTVTAQNNNISGAKEHGIIVQNGSTGTISGNKISSPVKNGVNVNNAAVTVSSNTVSYPGDIGIMIYNSKQTASKTVSGNTITISKGIAIQVNGSSNVTVRGNSISNSLKHGIQAYQSSNVSITDNVIKSSNMHGITVNYSTNTTVTYNTVTGNGSRDLCANDDSTGSASNNAITSGADRAWTYSASKFPMTKNGYEYWISYNANGGTGSMATTTVMYGVSTPTTANAFTRSGYTFTGWTAYRASDKKWYCGSDGWRTDAEINANGYKKHIYPNKSSVAKTTAVNGDKVTFYAQWKSNIITYTIKYNANGGSGSMADQTVTYGVSTATRSNAFKRSGYTFAGWTVYRASDKKWHCGSDGWRTAAEIAENGYKKFVYANTAKIATTTAVNGDTVTFYAQWKINTYTVKYNANGGSGSMADQTVTYGVSTATRSNAFKRSGYTFAGWTVYRASDKKWHCGSDGWRTAAEIAENGYKKFVYANTAKIATTTAVNGDTVTFYAQWKINTYTVKYNANGGSGSMADQTVTYGVSTATRSNTFKRSGYTFAGWTVYRASDKKWHCGSDGWRTAAEIAENGYKKFVYANTAKIATTTAVNGDTVTFYAQWKINTYTVKYNANGGTGSMADQTVTYGVSTATRSNAFKRSGYTFAGWTVYRASDKKWHCGSDGWRTAVEIAENGYKKFVYTNTAKIATTTAVNGDTVTFYAQWKINTYTVKYNANGGSGSMADQTVTYGVSTATRANAFTNDGYTFAGWTVYRASDKKWHCGSDGWRTDAEIAENGYKKFVYANAAKIATTTAVNGDTVTFYAQWKNN